MKIRELAIGMTIIACALAPSARAQDNADGVWQAGDPAAAPTTVGDITLFQSPTYEAQSTSEQHYDGTLQLRPKQGQLPLALTVNNGSEGKRAFSWFRINVAGYLLASEKDLAGAASKVIDVSGKMQPGSGQIVIEAAGEPGATLSFALKTPAIVLRSVHPKIAVRGQELVLHGRNFSSDESQDAVTIGGAIAEVLSAGANSLTVLVPANAPLGKREVRVSVDEVAAKPVSVMVSSRVAPIVLALNYWMAPPGATLTIQGQNFSTASSGNQVFFGDKQAQIVSASEDSISVQIPNWSYGGSQLNIPVYVVSDGVRSANSVAFDIGPKYLGGMPPYPGDSYSEASSQASSQATFGGSSQSSSDASSQATINSSSQGGTQSSSENPLRILPGQ